MHSFSVILVYTRKNRVMTRTIKLVHCQLKLRLSKRKGMIHSPSCKTLLMLDQATCFIFLGLQDRSLENVGWSKILKIQVDRVHKPRNKKPVASDWQTIDIKSKEVHLLGFIQVDRVILSQAGFENLPPNFRLYTTWHLQWVTRRCWRRHPSLPLTRSWRVKFPAETWMTSTIESLADEVSYRSENSEVNFQLLLMME
jgi:hypothetical protein